MAEENQDIQAEFDDLACHSCAHCGVDLMDSEADDGTLLADADPQYCSHCDQNICHACWHKQFPGAFCLVCAEGDL
jgi:hypothetical protein